MTIKENYMLIAASGRQWQSALFWLDKKLIQQEGKCFEAQFFGRNSVISCSKITKIKIIFFTDLSGTVENGKIKGIIERK